MALADTHVLDAPEPPVCLQGREQTDKATAPSPLGPASRQKSQMWLQQAQGILRWTLGIHSHLSQSHKKILGQEREEARAQGSRLAQAIFWHFLLSGPWFLQARGYFPKLTAWSYGTIYLEVVNLCLAHAKASSMTPHLFSLPTSHLLANLSSGFQASPLHPKTLLPTSSFIS